MSAWRKYERDIDVLLAEEFSVNECFAKWFIKTVAPDFPEVIVSHVEVSRYDRNEGGSDETDLLIALKSPANDDRYLVLIEDKLDASFTEKQLERYRQRSENIKNEEGYVDSKVVLCAPQNYHISKQNSQLVDKFVSHEEMAQMLRQFDDSKRSIYRAKFLEHAAEKSNTAYQRIDDANTNDFWDEVYRIANKHYTVLQMTNTPMSKDRGTIWKLFKPHGFPQKGMQIDLKGSMGFVDLTLNGIQVERLDQAVGHLLEQDMIIAKAGKSSAIRLEIPKWKAQPVTDDVSNTIHTGLNACVRMASFYRENSQMFSEI